MPIKNKLDERAEISTSLASKFQLREREREQIITAIWLRESLLRWTELRTHKRVHGGLLVSVGGGGGKMRSVWPLRPLIPAPANAVNLIVQIQSERVNAAWENPLSGERELPFFCWKALLCSASELAGRRG